MTKLRSQLSAADADERHAFPIVAWEYMEHIPLTSSREGVPSDTPVLPEPIDAVWLTTMTASSVKATSAISGRRRSTCPLSPLSRTASESHFGGLAYVHI